MFFSVFDKALEIILMKLNAWWEYVLSMLPNFITAILVLLVFFIIARFARQGLERILSRFSSNTSVNRIIAAISYFFIVIAGVFVALGILQLDKTVTSLLAGAGIVGLALGFAFQDIAVNFVSGLMIAFKKPLVIGDLVETNGHFGTVVKMDLRSVHLKTQQGQYVILPAKDIFQKAIINYTSHQERRVDVCGRVGYEEDLRAVKALVLEQVRKNQYRDEMRDPDLIYDEFDASTVNFTVRFWLKFNTHHHFLNARSEAIMDIQEAFREKGISMPYPVTMVQYRNGNVQEKSIRSNGEQKHHGKISD